MKIAFLLGSPDISGGTYVIFEHATSLSRKGHQVTVLTEGQVAAERYAWHPDAAELIWKTIAELTEEHFDIAIATWWQSVYRLPAVSSRKYLYFVQSIESRFFPRQDTEILAHRDIDIFSQWCEDTYILNLPVVTEARWIQRYLHEQYNRPSLLVRNGIRKDIYSQMGPALAKRQEGRLRVLVEGPLGVFYKNVEKTIELCRQAAVDEIWLLTSSVIDTYPGVDRCFSRVPIQETGSIYRSCDCLVKLSYVEGMFGPPLEMFHCGGTSLVYDVTGHDEYIRHLENSIVVARDDEQKVVAWLKKLQNDPGLLANLKKGASDTAASWPDWEVASDAFRLAIEDCERSLPDMNRKCIEYHCIRSLATRDGLLQARELQRLMAREQSTADVEDIFQNFIQMYWDCGRGIEVELSAQYQSGSWCTCRIIVPLDLPPLLLRVDPSVRIGVVEIRALRIMGERTGRVYRRWMEGGPWHEVGISGTARLLRSEPYPVLLAYGEDPQLYLPLIADIQGDEPIVIELELREVGVAKALLSSMGSIPLNKSSWRQLVPALAQRIVKHVANKVKSF